MSDEIELADQHERLEDLKVRLALSAIATGLRALEAIFSVDEFVTKDRKEVTWKT